MKKRDKTAHEPDDESGHDINTDGEPREQIHENSKTNKKASPDGQKKETSYFENPIVSELVNEMKFRADVHEVCSKLMSTFQVSPIYTIEDFEQDVIINTAKWFPSFRSEASLKTVLYRIAYNQLVNEFRDAENKAPHWEDFGFEDKDGEWHDGLEIAIRYRDRNRNLVANVADLGVLLKELESKLNTRERSLYTMHFVEGWTKTEISKALGVSRQAITKRIKRLSKKMRSFIAQQTSTDSSPGSVSGSHTRPQIRGLR